MGSTILASTTIEGEKVDLSTFEKEIVRKEYDDRQRVIAETCMVFIKAMTKIVKVFDDLFADAYTDADITTLQTINYLHKTKTYKEPKRERSKYKKIPKGVIFDDDVISIIEEYKDYDVVPIGLSGVYETKYRNKTISGREFKDQVDNHKHQFDEHALALERKLGQVFDTGRVPQASSDLFNKCRDILVRMNWPPDEYGIDRLMKNEVYGILSRSLTIFQSTYWYGRDKSNGPLFFRGEYEVYPTKYLETYGLSKVRPRNIDMRTMDYPHREKPKHRFSLDEEPNDKQCHLFYLWFDLFRRHYINDRFEVYHNMLSHIDEYYTFNVKYKPRTVIEFEPYCSIDDFTKQASKFTDALHIRIKNTKYNKVLWTN